jgi:hypothetical protein
MAPRPISTSDVRLRWVRHDALKNHAVPYINRVAVARVSSGVALTPLGALQGPLRANWDKKSGRRQSRPLARTILAVSDKNGQTMMSCASHPRGFVGHRLAMVGVKAAHRCNMPMEANNLRGTGLRSRADFSTVSSWVAWALRWQLAPQGLRRKR